MELYIRRQLDQRWKSEIGSATDSILVFSPYLTSSTADTVLKASRVRSSCDVHTVFKSENFITGASSIETLRRLAESGINLFSISRLHAKLIIVHDQFASIGSQNLTAGGRTSIEGSVVIRDKKQLAAIWNDVQLWRDQRTPITLEMIADMEQLVAPFSRQFRRLKKDATSIDQIVEKNEKEREAIRSEALAREEELGRKRNEDKERSEREERERVEKLRRLRELTDQAWEQRLVRSRGAMPASVTYLPNGKNAKYSLIAAHGSDLTYWCTATGDLIPFGNLKWCVCMISTTWELAFVRLAKTRITFVRSGISRSDQVPIGGRSWSIEFHTRLLSDDDYSEKKQVTNLTCNLNTRYKGQIVIPAWFHIDGMQFESPIITAGVYDTSEALSSWYDENRQEIEAVLLKSFSEPFRFVSGTLSSPSAESFFGDNGTGYSIRAASIDGCPFLVATRM